MKIAFVHEYLNQYGGAERVLQVLCAMFPRAPIYTAVYDPVATGGVFEGRIIRTSFLQRVPLAKRYHHAFSMLMPYAFEQFDTSSFDVVFSISASFAKGIITKPNVRHICYCLTPPRFLWDGSQKFVQEFGYPALVRKAIAPLLSYLRIWDRHAAYRVGEFVAISRHVGQRIEKYYQRQSPVIYPPVNVEKFQCISDTNSRAYFLMVGRLVAYKKFDLAIEACTRLNLPLKIVGDGVALARLKKIAGSTVEFLGQVGDETLAKLYQNARGLIFPQEEDFGIVPLEAMASGCPIIAFRGGGAEETVVDGVTGVFFDQQNVPSLMTALQDFEKRKFDPLACRTQAEKFDIAVFQKNILSLLTPNP